MLRAITANAWGYILILHLAKDTYRTLGPRLILGIVVVFASVLLVMFPVAEQRTIERELVGLDGVLNSQLDARLKALGKHVEQHKSDTLFLSNTPPVSAIVRALRNGGIDPVTNNSVEEWSRRLEQIFSAYMFNRGEVRQLRFIGVDDGGRERVRVDGTGDTVRIVPEAELQRKAHRDYFQEASNLAPGRVYSSGVDFNLDQAHVDSVFWETIRLATPVFDGNQELSGIVVMNLDFSFSQQILSEDLPEGYRAFLLDEDQHFLLHPSGDDKLAANEDASHVWDEVFDRPLQAELALYVQRDTGARWYMRARRLNYGEDHWVTLVVAANHQLIDTAVAQMRQFNALVFLGFSLISSLLLLQFVINLKRRDKAIARNAERVAIIDGSNDAIVAVTLTGEIISWNAAAQRLFGYTADEVVGKPCAALITPQDKEGEERAFLRQLRSGIAVPHIETQRQDRAGNLIEVSINVSPVKVGSTITSAAMIIRDIREEKESRTKLRKLNESLEELVAKRTRDLREALATQKVILERAGYGIIASDIDGKITLFNNAAEKMLGYLQEDVVGKRHIGSFFVGNDFRQAVKDQAKAQGGKLDTKALLKHGFSDEREWVFKRSNGETFPVLLKTVSMLGADDEVLGFLCVAVDLTQRKRQQEELEHARADAEEASKAKSEFLANMSHEIRTPMNAVLGMLNLLEHTRLDARQNDYVKKASGAAQALLGIINDILDFSKIEAGKLLLDPQPFNLGSVFRDLANILSMSASDKQLEILFNIDPAIPSEVCGDALRIRQVLINLAGNAVKFTDSGEVMISAVVQHQQTKRIVLGFSVRDTGIGMSQEQQQRIFQSFSQAEAGTTRRYGGSGLGLVICQQLIRLMGGELEMESEPGRGSTFSFSLVLDNVIGAAPQVTPVSELGQGMKNLRLLVIDDNANARHIVVATCQLMGWQCDEAIDGDSGLEKVIAAPESYDAVFIDWMMPGKNGWETAEAIRDAMPECCPKLIMVTAHAKDVYMAEEHALSNPMDGFLMKPVTASDIFNAVSDALGGVKHSQAATPLAAKAEGAGEQPLAGIRILLVEDNLINQQVARELLAIEGAQIELAGNGLEALALLQGETPEFDVVLMDLQMPEMDGLTATRKIRGELGMADLPIIAMTANALPSDREACLAAGMNDHIGKPFDIAELSEAVLAACGREGPGQHLEAHKPEQDLPASPKGFNFQEAFMRMGNNRKLLAAQASNFAKRHAGNMKVIENSMHDGNIELALRELHTLRGVAATLGAKALAGLVGDIEEACKRGANIDELPLARARDALAEACHVFTELGQQCGESGAALESGPSPAIDKAALLRGCRELEPLLADSNLRALEVHEQLSNSGLASVDGADALAEAMTNLDFAAAQGALSVVLAALAAQGDT